MRIVLDTGALWKRETFLRLLNDRREAVLPAAAYAERVRQLLRDGRAAAELDALLDGARIRVEPMGREEATAFVHRLLDDAAWRRRSFDALIAGHVGPGDELWTTNARDFALLGVPREKIVAFE